MKYLLLLSAIIFALISCKKEEPVNPASNIHTVVMKFHGENPTRLLRNYTIPVNGTMVNKCDTVYQQNTTVTYSFRKNTSVMTDNEMLIQDIDIPLSTFKVSCEMWIDNVKVAFGDLNIGSSGCSYYIY